MGIWAQIAVILAFLLIVLHSKHLHIGAAPVNVYTSRRPNALGPLLPIYYKGEPVNFEDPPDDATFGKGHIAEFTWKNYVDFMACTECGRCQSQCPAWNTGKPLSPKLMIMNLRDTMFTQAPYLKAAGGEHPGLGEMHEAALAAVSAEVREQVERPFIGPREGSEHSAEDGYTFDGHRTTGLELPIIDEDALWSCTTCGACVNQCPVDIEHIDHFVDMRRNQVMIATEFPSELNGLFKNLETKGNPWGMNASGRNDWISEVDFDVRVFGMDGEDTIPDDVDYLFWVGCAGAFEDRAKRTTKAVAELLTIAGVQFMVLGEGETCTGDPARRAGNEFLFQMQAMQNVEVLNEIKATKIVVTCPHCLNTLKREYPQLGGNYEVVHHTQLLNDLVKAGRLTPVAPVQQTVTYHDPCYLGRHNNVYVPPRDLIEATGATSVEMERHGDKSFCCGAGGARMWMEEKIGTRVNQNRGDEAIGTGATKVAVACPFCSVMLNDAVTSRQGEGKAEGVEVVDVATLLLSASKPSRSRRLRRTARVPSADAQHLRLGAGQVDDRRRHVAALACVDDRLHQVVESLLDLPALRHRLLVTRQQQGARHQRLAQRGQQRRHDGTAGDADPDRQLLRVQQATGDVLRRREDEGVGAGGAGLHRPERGVVQGRELADLADVVAHQREVVPVVQAPDLPDPLEPSALPLRQPRAYPESVG